MYYFTQFHTRTPTQDRDGSPRVTGEEWLVKKIGAYLPGAYEEVVELVDAYVLTEKVSSATDTLLERFVWDFCLLMWFT